MSEAHDRGLAMPNWLTAYLENIDTAAGLSGVLIDGAQKFNGVVAREQANITQAWLEALQGPPTPERLATPVSAARNGAAEISAAYAQFCRTLAAHCEDEISRSLSLWNGCAEGVLSAWVALMPAAAGSGDTNGEDTCCGDCTSKTCSRLDPFQTGIHGALSGSQSSSAHDVQSTV